MNKEELKRKMVVLDDEMKDIEDSIRGDSKTLEIKTRLQRQLSEKADKHWDLYVQYYEI